MSDLPFKFPLKSPIEAWCWMIYHAPITTTQRGLATEWGWTAPKVQRLIEKWASDGWIDAKGGRGGTEIILGKSAPLPKHALGHRDQIDANIDAEIGDLFGRDEAQAPPSRKQTKASRIPENWWPTKRLGQWAMDLGLTDQQVRVQASAFVDHWRQSNKSTAMKKDWDAAFRTWIRRSATWTAEKEAPGGDGALDELRAKYGQ